jgi:hypothetical protein
MKSTIFALLAVSAFPLAAFAQQQEVSPELQAMSGKIMREVSEGLQCQAASIKLAKENETLKARVKELEAKAPDHPDGVKP